MRVGRRIHQPFKQHVKLTWINVAIFHNINFCYIEFSISTQCSIDRVCIKGLNFFFIVQESLIQHACNH